MWKSFAALLLTAAGAFAQQQNPTAYDALRVLGEKIDRDYVNRVISMTGVDGNPQPARWKILLDDSNRKGGVREVEIEGGRVVADRNRPAVGTAAGATVNTTKLNLDSSGAYAVADKAADSSHVPYGFVSYTLRTDERGNPTWIVTLQSQNRRPVGTVHIGANQGTITRTEGMFQGIPTDTVVEDNREGKVADEEREGDNPVMRSVRHMFYRTRDNASDTFRRVRHNFADFIRGED